MIHFPTFFCFAHISFLSQVPEDTNTKTGNKTSKISLQPGHNQALSTSIDNTRRQRGCGHLSATRFCICLSDNDSPRCSHLDDRVSNFSQCHCTACGIGSPSQSCCIVLGLQWHWSASDCRSQPEAIGNGHCQMETIPQHLKKMEAREENRYLELKSCCWQWIYLHLLIGLRSTTFHRHIMECPL